MFPHGKSLNSWIYVKNHNVKTFTGNAKLFITFHSFGGATNDKMTEMTLNPDFAEVRLCSLKF